MKTPTLEEKPRLFGCEVGIILTLIFAAFYFTYQAGYKEGSKVINYLDDGALTRGCVLGVKEASFTNTGYLSEIHCR